MLCHSTNLHTIGCLAPLLVYSIEVKGIRTMRHTKAQVLEQFRYNWKVATLADPALKTDKIAKRIAFGDFTDMLCKNGDITLKQYETWSNPF